MKKFLLVFFVLDVGVFMTAQQSGINTTDPKATLDVVSNTDATSADVEGLLVPRVSKQKALLMGGSSPKESTLIYVNDLTYTDPNDATKDRVAEVTENGYYHWNGTKWVKHVGQNGDEWVYDATTEQIDLKRIFDSGYEKDIYFDANTGVYVSRSTDTFERYNNTNNTWIDSPLPLKSLQNFTVKGASLPSWVPVDATYSIKRLRNSYLLLDSNDKGQEEQSATGISRELNSNNLVVKSDNNNAYSRLYANNNNLESHTESPTTHTYVRANRNLLYYQGAANISESGIANYNQTEFNSTGTAKYLTSAYNNTIIGEDAGEVTSATSIFSKISSESTNLLGYGIVSDAHGEMVANSKAVYLIGYRYVGAIDANATLAGHYGIYLNDVSGASSNYAIFTNDGKVHFGDNVETMGVLKVGNDTSVTPTAGMIRYNASTDKFEGYVKDNGSGSAGWVAFH